MKKNAKGDDGRKAARGQLWLYLPGMVREALYGTVIGAGLACVDEVLEMEPGGRCVESVTSISPIARGCFQGLVNEHRHNRQPYFSVLEAVRS